MRGLEGLKFATMGPNDPNFEAKLFSLSKQLEQLIQVLDWVMLKGETGAVMQHM